MNIEHLEQLAKIELTEEERVKTIQELGKILEYMNELQDISADIEKSVQENVYREDIPVRGYSREEMLANAPEVSFPYIKVPRTI